MKNRADKTDWPRRWRDGNVGAGPIMRKYVRHLEGVDGIDEEPRAFARTKATLQRRTARRLIAGTAALAGVGAMVVTLWLGVFPARPQPLQTALLPSPAPGPVRAPALPSAPASTSAAPSPPSIRLGSKPIALGAGRIELEDQASVLVAQSTKASARSERGDTTIRLDSGRVDLHVRPQAPGHSLAVTAGPFNFVVIGTSFSVRRQRDHVTLQVTEGRVAVMRGNRTLARVTIGQSWTGQIDDGPAASPPPPTSPATMSSPSAVPVACADLLTAGRTRQAIACLDRRAAQGSGPDSDVAAYEAARLWKDDVGDLEQARMAFQSYAARFPQGALRVEAALSLVEILPRLGRHQEALAQAARLLTDPAAAPRRAEIHLLRGNIFRLALGDRAAAMDEYRAAAGGDGKAADEARRRMEAMTR
jgi:ferric-dicitrate binding protein FerR (iron transport regulator)